MSLTTPANAPASPRGRCHAGGQAGTGVSPAAQGPDASDAVFPRGADLRRPGGDFVATPPVSGATYACLGGDTSFSNLAACGKEERHDRKTVLVDGHPSPSTVNV